MRNRPLPRACDLEADPVEHYTRLAEEFGHSRRQYKACDDGRSLGGARLMLEPLSLFIFALLALIAVAALQLWRIGAFDPVFGTQSARVDPAPKQWLLNGHAPRVADDRALDRGDPEIATLSTPADDPDENAAQ